LPFLDELLIIYSLEFSANFKVG